METLYIPKTSDKSEIYKAIIPQIEALVSTESDIIANLANVSAVLKEAFNFFWVGFYLVKNDELVLGPFQGPLACTRIRYGRGVCGNAWKESRTLVVPDVEAFPGHIACSSLSKSEIVIPLFKDNKVVGVLDVDSEFIHHFDEIDALEMQRIAQIIEEKL